MAENKTAVTLEEYKAALTKIGSQETEIKQLKEQLVEATDALTIIKTKFDTAEAAEKEDTINELVKDSNGKLTKEGLSKHSLQELYLVKDALAQAEPKNFVSVMRQREKDAETKKPHGTVGSYDQETKEYTDGIKV